MVHGLRDRDGHGGKRLDGVGEPMTQTGLQCSAVGEGNTEQESGADQ